MDIKELYKLDLYGILEIEEDATDKQIVKAYRKRALKCHPDKNQDNPKAGEEFHRLSRALEILTDAAARAAYDQSRKAKKAAQERTRVLDSKRKKFKEDLEAREQAFFEQTQRANELQAEKKLQAEVERLRKEGSRLLEQEQERLREELKKSAQSSHSSEVAGVPDDPSDAISPRIKLKWKAAKSDTTNGGYNTSNLTGILACYGNISALIVSGKRNGSAIVEFEKSGVTSDILDETGLPGNPFSIVWLSGKPLDKSVQGNAASQQTTNLNEDGKLPENQNTTGVNFSLGNFPTGQFGSNGQVGSSDGNNDFESIVLRNMRLAEERKKLIQQMMEEDGEEK